MLENEHLTLPSKRLDWALLVPWHKNPVRASVNYVDYTGQTGWL